MSLRQDFTLDIEYPYNQLFAKYEKLNEVQAGLLTDLLHKNNSVVLRAPTGSGKTIAFELAIVRELQLHKQHTIADSQLLLPKAIYVAPMKALCAERYQDWVKRFLLVGVTCAQLTGDTEYCDRKALDEAQLIITTPEKWDSVTRHWGHYIDILRTVRLFMIDEVHLLNEDIRGPILEAIVARMKTIAQHIQSHTIRFVIASATIPNVQDLADWLSEDTSSMSAPKVLQLVFDDNQRPIPLEKYILGYNSNLKGFRFDITLNYKLPDVLRKYAEQKATLIFCNGRKSTEMAALVLERHTTTIFMLTAQQKNCLAQLALRFGDAKLRRLVACGIAYHHAGMSSEERQLVEQSFRNGQLMVLLCTSTLAMGVNLPARLVIVKSTETYNKGTLMEYSESQLLQMIGRAGRAQYDTKGIAVILTHSRNVRKYEQLVNGSVPVESHLHQHLAEHLNSEIALSTIGNLEIAMNWIRSTYLYVRAMKNPKRYGLGTQTDKDLIESKLEEMCLLQINALHDAGLITRNVTGANGLAVQTTAYGKLMSTYYISFETMKLFRQLRGTATFLEILNMIVRCKEFDDFQLRVNEKRDLNDLNNKPLRFPIPGRIKSNADKISCLIQAIFGNYTINAPGLSQEATKMIRIGERLSKCLLEYIRLYRRESHDFNTGCYKALLHAVTIAKCFHAKLWENSVYAAKQLRKIGAVYSSLLANAGKTTLKSIAMTDARTIERILKKSSPFGEEVLQQLMRNFPEYSIEFTRAGNEMLQVRVRQVNEFYNVSAAMQCNAVVLIVGDTTDKMLLYNENIDNVIMQSGCFERTFKICNAQAEAINAHLIHATIVGVDCHATYVLNPTATSSTSTSKEVKSKTPTKKTKTRKRPATDNIDESTKGKVAAANVSALPDDSFLQNLQVFAFEKTKLQTLNKSVDNAFETVEARRRAKPTANTTKTPNNTVNNGTLLQTTVTEYFRCAKNYARENDDSLEAAELSANNQPLPASAGKVPQSNEPPPLTLTLSDGCTNSKSNQIDNIVSIVDSQSTTAGVKQREQQPLAGDDANDGYESSCSFMTNVNSCLPATQIDGRCFPQRTHSQNQQQPMYASEAIEDCYAARRPTAELQRQQTQQVEVRSSNSVSYALEQTPEFSANEHHSRNDSSALLPQQAETITTVIEQQNLQKQYILIGDRFVPLSDFNALQQTMRPEEQTLLNNSNVTTSARFCDTSILDFSKSKRQRSASVNANGIDDDFFKVPPRPLANAFDNEISLFDQEFEATQPIPAAQVPPTRKPVRKQQSPNPLRPMPVLQAKPSNTIRAKPITQAPQPHMLRPMPVLQAQPRKPMRHIPNPHALPSKSSLEFDSAYADANTTGNSTNISSDSGSRECLKFWYQVTLSFNRLRIEHQNFDNFKYIYQHLTEQRRQLHEDSQRRRQWQRRPQETKPVRQLGRAANVSHQQHYNPYRLQLCDDANAAGNVVCPTTVNSVNCRIMNFVLQQKYQSQQAQQRRQQHVNNEDDQRIQLSLNVTELLRESGEEDEDDCFKTFEDYERHYIG